MQTRQNGTAMCINLPDASPCYGDIIYLVVQADIEALKASDKANANCILATRQDAVCHIIQVICSMQATLMPHDFCQYNSCITANGRTATQASHRLHKSIHMTIDIFT